MTRAIMNGCNGKMGQCITGICAQDEDIEIVAGIDTYDGIKNDYPVFASLKECTVDADVIIDFSIYDAIRAGFNRIVLIIKHEIYNDVREMFGNRIEESTGIKIDYAFQTLDRFTESRPEFKARTKPFGTVHAVICAADCIKTPFAVMNADDYYLSLIHI